MKKIISALTLGALIGAAAFADVEINLNLRQRASLYAASSVGGAKANKSFGWLDAYSAAGDDSFKFSLSGDIVAFDIGLVSSESKNMMTSGIRAKVLMASLFLGPVTLQAGANADGIVNGAYRTKSDLDFGNFEGMDFEFKKLGSAFKNSPAAFADNLIGHVNNANGSEYLSFVANYGLKFDKGAATFKAAMVTNETLDESGSPKNSAHAQGHQFSFLADGRMDGIGQAEAVFKVGEYRSPTDKDKNGYTAMTFGLYAQPTINKNLILTAGGAVGVVDYDVSDVSFDLRARYQAIPKKLSITSFHSFSFLTDDGINKISDGGAELCKAIAGNNAPQENKGNGKAIGRDKILSNNLMVRYNVNDTLTVYGIAADMIGLGKSKGEAVKAANNKDDAGAYVQLRFSGWAQFFATKAASINVGLVCAVDDATDYKDAGDAYHAGWNWTVPMVLRIKF